MKAPGARAWRWPSAPPRRATFGLIVLAALGLGAGFILTQPSAPKPLVALAGGLLVFGVPGVALTRALFPGPGMGRAERMALTIGTQLSLIVMCGFLLHLLRPGLSSVSWGSLLADITLIACAAAWVRGRGSEVHDAGARPTGARTSPGWIAAISSGSMAQLAMLIGAGMLVTLALVVARAGVVAQPQPAWTALAIEAVHAGRAVSVGVTNAEGQPQTYRLLVTIDGELLTALEGLRSDSLQKSF